MRAAGCCCCCCCRGAAEQPACAAGCTQHTAAHLPREPGAGLAALHTGTPGEHLVHVPLVHTCWNWVPEGNSCTREHSCTPLPGRCMGACAAPVRNRHEMLVMLPVANALTGATSCAVNHNAYQQPAHMKQGSRRYSSMLVASGPECTQPLTFTCGPLLPPLCMCPVVGGGSSFPRQDHPGGHAWRGKQLPAMLYQRTCACILEPEQA